MNEDVLHLLSCSMIEEFCHWLLYLNVLQVGRQERNTKKLQHSKGLSPVLSSTVATSHMWLFKF